MVRETSLSFSRAPGVCALCHKKYGRGTPIILARQNKWRHACCTIGTYHAGDVKWGDPLCYDIVLIPDLTHVMIDEDINQIASPLVAHPLLVDAMHTQMVAIKAWHADRQLPVQFTIAAMAEAERKKIVASNLRKRKIEAELAEAAKAVKEAAEPVRLISETTNPVEEERPDELPSKELHAASTTCPHKPPYQMYPGGKGQAVVGKLTIYSDRVRI